MRFSIPMSLALTASLIVPATASAQTCVDMTSLPTYIACTGALDGNIGANSGMSAELSLLSSTFGSTFTYAGQSGDSGFGPFSTNPAGSTSGLLTFDTAVSGLFVIGLKAADTHSYYLYNAGGGAFNQITFNTIGSGTNVHGTPQNLSHATLYLASTGATTVVTNAVVPEPSTYALMTAGLAALGFFARKRRQA